MILALAVATLAFTAPADSTPWGLSHCAAYELLGLDTLGLETWYSPAQTPRTPGSSDTVRLMLPDSGPYFVALRAVDARGNVAAWSNVLLIAVTQPDTNFYAQGRAWPGGRWGASDQRGIAALAAYPQGTPPWPPALNLGAWIAARVESQEAIQLRYKNRICELEGTWALRGQLWPCH